MTKIIKITDPNCSNRLNNVFTQIPQKLIPLLSNHDISHLIASSKETERSLKSSSYGRIWAQINSEIKPKIHEMNNIMSEHGFRLTLAEHTSRWEIENIKKVCCTTLMELIPFFFVSSYIRNAKTDNSPNPPADGWFIMCDVLFGWIVAWFTDKLFERNYTSKFYSIGHQLMGMGLSLLFGLSADTDTAKKLFAACAILSSLGIEIVENNDNLSYEVKRIETIEKEIKSETSKLDVVRNNYALKF